MIRSERAETQVESRSGRIVSTWILQQMVKRLLASGSIGLLLLFSQGCSSNHFSGSPGWMNSLSANRTQAVLPDRRIVANGAATGPNRQQAPLDRTRLATNKPSFVQPTTQPTSRQDTSVVTTVSYSAPGPRDATTRTVSTNGASTPTEFAGLRRHSAAICQNEAECGVTPGGGTPTPGCAMPSDGCAACEPARWDIDPQEFICDGGDRDPATIVKEDWSAAGIDTTDTVMYYETLGGQVCIRPSNRTCVYAPRFGCVRQVTGAALAANTLAPGRVHGPQAAVGVIDRNIAGNVELAAKPVGQKQVQTLDRLNDQQRIIPIDMIQPPTPIGALVNPQINLDRTRADESLGREWADLIGKRIEVVTLTNPEELSVILSDQAAHLVIDSEQAAEVYLYETPDKCSMRITKTASHQMASPGDRIRFTIRFENMGTQKLGNAVILDSLSPRLKYIEGSQLCSVEAEFSTQPNEAGSSILRWSILNPIEANKGGVISFDCEVR